MLFKCCKQVFDENSFSSHMVKVHNLCGEIQLNTRLMNRITSTEGKVAVTYEHRVLGHNLTFLQLEEVK